MIEQRKHKQKLGLLQLPTNRQQQSNYSNSAMLRNNQGMHMGMGMGETW